jgi:hypothetical protein
MRRRIIVVGAAAGLTLAGVAGAAALPGVVATQATDHVQNGGADVGNPNDNAGTHPDTRGQSDATHGSEVSNLARTTTATGVDKGAAVSALASGGKSQAGQHGGGADAPGSAVVDTPNDGGTTTADAASGGASADGTANANANANSDGHAAAGSANAAAGLAHKP